MDARDVLTVAQMEDLNPAFTQSTLRWWIFNAEENGFGACLLRVRGRVYIDRIAFELWLEGHRVEAISEPENAFDECD